MQISQMMTSYTQTNFWLNMINKDISINFFQKCLVFCSKVLLEALCNMSLQFCYHGNMLDSRPPRYKRLFWPLEAFYTVYCQWCVICMIQQAFKYVRLSSWPCLMSSKLRTTKILKSGWRDWKRVVIEIVMAVGVLHLELLACQVSMVSAANWRR